MAAGLSTGTIFPTGNTIFRNPMQTNTENNTFTAKYDSSVGPTRENLAEQQHQADIDKLASEIAAKETPSAKAARDDSSYFAKSAEERKLQAQKDALQKKLDDDALEKAVKADEFFLVQKEWDRKVIKAANGETVTVEMEDTSAAVSADGTYPKKTVEITKSSRLRSLSSASASPTPSAASIQTEYLGKKNALLNRYYNSGSIGFNSDGSISGGNAQAIAQYQKEIAALNEKEAQAVSALANKTDSAPPSQGKNVEPHTIAIYAPGYCMEDGCCLEKAYYTLRSACKAIENDADAEAKAQLKDMYDRRKQMADKIDELTKKATSQYDTASQKAGELGSKDYQTAYKKSVTYSRDAEGHVTMSQGPKPRSSDYSADVYLSRNQDLLEDYKDTSAEVNELAANLSDYDQELNEKYKEVLAQLQQDAKNYRLLLDHCTFQPTCPEWLEDAGAKTISVIKSTAEAITDAFEWASKTYTECVETIQNTINDSLAYIGDLQDQLSEYVNFKGLCSLNPFGGTLGCANCPMGSTCTSQQAVITQQIQAVQYNNTFLMNLKRAMGLGDGQLLGNLLQCASAVSNQYGGVLDAVSDYSMNNGMSESFISSSSLMGQNERDPRFQTRMADCVGNAKTYTDSNRALQYMNNTRGGPQSLMQSQVHGMDIGGTDFGKVDRLNSTSKQFTKGAMGSDKSALLSSAKNKLPVEKPKGSTRYYDGKNVGQDSTTRQRKIMQSAGVLSI